MAVAVLNRNEPAFHCVPAWAYEELMDLVDNLELGRIVDARLTKGQEAALISHTCIATCQLQLSSYDRLFPNQDTLAIVGVCIGSGRCSGRRMRTETMTITPLAG